MRYSARLVEALIVGGGPAGLAAAIVLARAGVRTLLCEKKAFPVNKVCGEGVMPTGVAHLGHLGVNQYLATEDVYPFVGVCYRTPAGPTTAATFAEGPGWGIVRSALSAALLCRASELDCLEVRQETVAKPLARTSDAIIVKVGHQTVRTRLLLGADGLNSPVRRWAGLEKRPRRLSRLPTPRRWGARQHFHIVPWSDYVEVHWGKGIEAYVTPCGARQVNVAFLWDPSRYGRVQGGPGFFDSLRRSFPRLETRLKRSEAADEPRAIGPLYRPALSPAADGVLLIGDAAGYLDAITGEGISLALGQALALETTIVPLLREGKEVPDTIQLAAYTRAYRAIVRPYYHLTWLALLLSRYPALAQLVIGTLSRQPELFRYLLSANMGLAPLWSLPFGMRLLRSLFQSTIAGVAAQPRVFPGDPAGE